LRGVLIAFYAKSVVTKYCEIPFTVRLRGMPQKFTTETFAKWSLVQDACGN
jgi:hypothetical protein